MPQTVDHDQLELLLRQAQIGIAAAELQGSLCALLCLEGAPDPDQWLAESLGSELNLYALEPELREQLTWLYDGTSQWLRGGQFDFQLLLPADEAPLRLRTSALALWCSGFLAAMGPRAGPDLNLLSEEIGDFLRDLLQISRADFHGDADESDESQFLELAEYVRLGAMTAFESLAALRPEPAQQPGYESGDDPALH